MRQRFAGFRQLTRLYEIWRLWSRKALRNDSTRRLAVGRWLGLLDVLGQDEPVYRCAERHLAEKRIYESEKEPGGQPSPCKNDHIIHGRFDARVTVFVGRIRFLRHAAMVTISETIRTKKYQ